MKKYFTFCLLFMCMSLAGFSQERYSVFLSGGYDYNANHLTGMQYNNSSKFPDYNLGVGAAVYLNERFRLRAEFKYVNISFTRKYDFVNATSAALDRTNMSVSRFDFKPYVDYRVISFGKFDLYGFAGLCLDLNMGNKQKSYTLGGETSNTRNVETDYQRVMIGITGGCSLSYNVSKKLAIFASPEYTQFLNYFYPENSASLSRASLNLGVEWKF